MTIDCFHRACCAIGDLYIGLLIEYDWRVNAASSYWHGFCVLIKCTIFPFVLQTAY
jgi:hypothetical protein